MNVLTRWVTGFAMALMILPSLPSAFAQNFSITSASWTPGDIAASIEWDIDVTAGEFDLTFDAFTYPGGSYVFSLDPIYFTGSQRLYGMPVDPGMQYDITMKAYDPDGNIIGDDSISLFTDTGTSNQTYEGFGINAADYDESSEIVTVYLETYSNTSNDIPIENFFISYNVHDLNSGDFLYSIDNVMLDRFETEPTEFFGPGLEILAYVEAYATDGTLIGGDDITIDTGQGTTAPTGPQSYEGFVIDYADYNASTEELTLKLERFSTSSNDININYFDVTYNIYDLISGDFLYSIDNINIFRTEEKNTQNILPGVEVFINVDAYASDGTYIGSDDITVDTGLGSTGPSQPTPFPPPPGPSPFPIDDFDYNYDFDDFNEFYFVNGLAVDSAGVSAFWDNTFAPGITEFELFYDIYDFNGNYLYGSPVFYADGRTSEFDFPRDSILDLNQAQEVLLTVNAYDQFGFFASDYLSHFTGDIPFDDFDTGYGFLELDIGHSYGPYYVVDLLEGEKVSFYAFDNPFGDFVVNKRKWEQFPNDILDCTVSNNGLQYDCIAKAPGDTDISYFATGENPNGETIEEYSPAVVVYVYDNFGNLGICKEYEVPSCPNGVIYHPPAADGCLGQPICQVTGQNISSPLQGFEDEVIVRTREEAGKTTNIFPDTDNNSLASIAANELYLRGVLGGFPDGEFKGNRPVNRAEAAKFLMLAKEIRILAGLLDSDNPFWDVILSEWYGPFVITAAQKGVIEGHPDGSFKPGDGVNTAEFLAMLARCFGLELNLDSSMYKDKGKWDAWVAQYAGIAAKYDLFPDRDKDILDPGRKLTRNEVAIAIYQYLRNRNK